MTMPSRLCQRCADAVLARILALDDPALHVRASARLVAVIAVPITKTVNAGPVAIAATEKAAGAEVTVRLVEPVAVDVIARAPAAERAPCRCACLPPSADKSPVR